MLRSEVAKITGVHVETLRFYETKGLISPTRTASGYRSYDTQMVQNIQTIREAQGLGFTLAEIKLLLSPSLGSPGNYDAAHAIVNQKILEINERITKLEELKIALAQRLRACAGPQ